MRWLSFWLEESNWNPTNPTNYRPIAFTIFICKTMEPMINRRLKWYLESHKLLTNVQCGFRSRRSTIDHLVTFQTFCREAFIHNQHLVLGLFVVVVLFFGGFFFLKAYNTIWKYGIMKALHGFGLRGRLSNVLKIDHSPGGIYIFWSPPTKQWVYLRASSYM